MAISRVSEPFPLARDLISFFAFFGSLTFAEQTADSVLESVKWRDFGICKQIFTYRELDVLVNIASEERVVLRVNAQHFTAFFGRLFIGDLQIFNLNFLIKGSVDK